MVRRFTATFYPGYAAVYSRDRCSVSWGSSNHSARQLKTSQEVVPLTTSAKIQNYKHWRDIHLKKGLISTFPWVGCRDSCIFSSVPNLNHTLLAVLFFFLFCLVFFKKEITELHNTFEKFNSNVSFQKSWLGSSTSSAELVVSSFVQELASFCLNPQREGSVFHIYNPAEEAGIHIMPSPSWWVSGSLRDEAALCGRIKNSNHSLAQNSLKQGLRITLTVWAISGNCHLCWDLKMYFYGALSTTSKVAFSSILAEWKQTFLQRISP